MWVYPSDEVRTSPETTALLPQLPAESGTPKQPVPEPLNAGEAMPDGVAQQPERLHRRMRHASRDCCLLAAAFCVVRALSVNVERRRMENQRFLSLFRGRHNGCGWWAKMEQRKEYKIFKCPSCGVKLRVPRGKGKIKVTCRQCGATFEEKS